LNHHIYRKENTDRNYNLIESEKGEEKRGKTHLTPPLESKGGKDGIRTHETLTSAGL
jgi:hypothetical protein